MVKHKIVIELRGGLVCSVHTNFVCEYVVVDHDALEIYDENDKTAPHISIPECPDNIFDEKPMNLNMIEHLKGLKSVNNHPWK